MMDMARQKRKKQTSSVSSENTCSPLYLPPFLFFFPLSLFCPPAAGYKAAGVVVMLPFEDVSLRPV